MIRVTVELDKFGRGDEVEKLGVIEIVNNGEGDAVIGTYDAYLLNENGDVLDLALGLEHRRRQGWQYLLLRVLSTFMELPIG